MPASRTHQTRRDPPERVEVPEVRLFRTEDLVVARLRAPGCHVEPGPDGPELVADTDPASLVLELPPQHLGEHAWLESETPAGLAAHRAAAPSRVVFALPVGARVPFTLAGVLGVLPTLPLRVAGHATPADPTRALDARWTDAILVRGWERLLDRADAAGQTADLGDLVFGIERPTVRRGSALSDSAARVLQRAQAGRLVGALNRPVSVVSVLARERRGRTGEPGPGRRAYRHRPSPRPARPDQPVAPRTPAAHRHRDLDRGALPPPGVAQPVRRVHPRPRTRPGRRSTRADRALADAPDGPHRGRGRHVHRARRHRRHAAHRAGGLDPRPRRGRH